MIALSDTPREINIFKEEQNMEKWTNCEKTIQEMTKRTIYIGNVEINGKKYDVLNKNKDEDNAYIYDSKTGNFHFLPALDTGTNVDTDIMSYLTAVEVAQEKIYNIIKDKDKFKLKNRKGKGTGRLERYPSEYKDKYGDDKNYFFKHITVKIEDHIYTINFMKWYIKNDILNCKFGEIQFNTTTQSEGRINQDGIYYPECEGSQSELSLNGEYQECFYNPKDVGDIWEIVENDEKAQKVVEEFEKFIDNV